MECVCVASLKTSALGGPLQNCAWKECSFGRHLQRRPSLPRPAQLLPEAAFLPQPAQNQSGDGRRGRAYVPLKVPLNLSSCSWTVNCAATLLHCCVVIQLRVQL
eukprot:358262-Chlamydomonas_euryale.AAC.20